MALALSCSPSLRANDLLFHNNRPNATLLELYSSEGCSSCPPAEAWVSTLKQSPVLWTELFPVAFHVDYWNHLGWPDRYSQATFTQRQNDYASHLGQDSVYTPEFIAGGREWRGWFQGNRQPRAATRTTGELALQVNSGGQQASARYTPGPELPDLASCTLHVALLGMNIHSDIRAGENSGRELVHDFVVLNLYSAVLTRTKDFHSNPVALHSSTDDRPGAIVAWVSDSNGAILQVTGGYLPPPGAE